MCYMFIIQTYLFKPEGRIKVQMIMLVQHYNISSEIYGIPLPNMIKRNHIGKFAHKTWFLRIMFIINVNFFYGNSCKWTLYTQLQTLIYTTQFILHCMLYVLLTYFLTWIATTCSRFHSRSSINGMGHIHYYCR